MTCNLQSAESLSPFVQDEMPKVYDEVRAPDRQATAELLKAWQASFFTCSEGSDESEHQYLDVGCGPGNFVRNHLLPLCPPALKRLVATDNSKAMIDYAKRVHAHPKVEHRLLDIAIDDEVTDFIAKEGCFQRVYSFLALHWIEDKCAALRNIERLLTPGGECLVIFNPYPGPAQLYQALLDSDSWAKYRDILRRAMPVFSEPSGPASCRKRLADLVSTTGLVSLSCELVRIKIASASIDDAVRFFLLLTPIYSLLSEDEKPELARFIRKFLLQGHCSNFSPNGTTHQLRFVFHGYKP
ncbi:juvenile hormone acid O-methyltransferase-like isoform X2 [Amblyomma americanum]